MLELADIVMEHDGPSNIVWYDKASYKVEYGVHNNFTFVRLVKSAELIRDTKIYEKVAQILS
jgi:hypothetical protein